MKCSNTGGFMDRTRMIEIFKGNSGRWEGDNAYQGLQILSKYTKDLIQGADHEELIGILYKLSYTIVTPRQYRSFYGRRKSF